LCVSFFRCSCRFSLQGGCSDGYYLVLRECILSFLSLPRSPLIRSGFAFSFDSTGILLMFWSAISTSYRSAFISNWWTPCCFAFFSISSRPFGSARHSAEFSLLFFTAARWRYTRRCFSPCDWTPARPLANLFLLAFCAVRGGFFDLFLCSVLLSPLAMGFAIGSFIPPCGQM